MDNPIGIALLFLVVMVIIFYVSIFILYKSIGKEVERMLELTKDDPEAQAEIRKKVVRALYPPRFPID